MKHVNLLTFHITQVTSLSHICMIIVKLYTYVLNNYKVLQTLWSLYTTTRTLVRDWTANAVGTQLYLGREQ